MNTNNVYITGEAYSLAQVNSPVITSFQVGDIIYGSNMPHLRKAAGTQITQWPKAEVVTKNNDTGLIRGPVIGMSTL